MIAQWGVGKSRNGYELVAQINGTSRGWWVRDENGALTQARLFHNDQDRDQYLLLKTGWSQGRRVRGVTLFLRLRDGKVWVEEDWTEEGIATELVKAGVPREDIVLAFHPPQVRPLTEFAVP